MLAPSALLRHAGGIARGTYLQGYGHSRHRLNEDVRSGAIIRVRPGVFALPDTDDKTVTAAHHGGALTCADALRARGVWVLPKADEIVHVWMGRSGRRHHEKCECVPHFSHGRTALGLAPVAEALLHLYRCNDDETFFAAYESAWNKRILPASDRKRIRRELPRSARWLLDFARSDAQSGLESLLRLRLHLLGIRLECQVDIETVGRVDFVAGGRVIIETDGKANHTGDLRHQDLMRDARASELGYETLRFDYKMVIHNWEVVAPAILGALQRAAE